MAEPSSSAQPVRSSSILATVAAQQVKILSAEAQLQLKNIDELLLKIRAIPQSNNPADIPINYANKVKLLTEGYDICRTLILAHKQDPIHPDVSKRLFLFLGEDALHLYGNEFAADRWKPSLQVNFGALTALLYHVKLTDSYGDFSKPHMENLEHFNKEVMTHTPFAFIEQQFRRLNTDVCLQKIEEQGFSPDDIVRISILLRYTSGAWRGIRITNNKLAGTPNKPSSPEDNEITIKLLLLAEKLMVRRLEQERDPNHLESLKQEFYRLKYNDGPDLINALALPPAEAAAKQIELRSLVDKYAPAKQERVWIWNKFSDENDVEGIKTALRLGVEIINHYLTQAQQETLKGILEGKILDAKSIKEFVPALFNVGKDKGFEFDMPRFAMIPYNVAVTLLETKSSNLNEIFALLRLTVVLTDAYIVAGYSHAVPHHYNKAALQMLMQLANEAVKETLLPQTQVNSAMQALPQTPSLEKPAEDLEELTQKIATMEMAEFAKTEVWLQIDVAANRKLLSAIHDSLDKGLECVMDLPQAEAVAAVIRKEIKKNVEMQQLLNKIENIQNIITKRKQELASKKSEA